MTQCGPRSFDICDRYLDFINLDRVFEDARYLTHSLLLGFSLLSIPFPALSASMSLKPKILLKQEMIKFYIAKT